MGTHRKIQEVRMSIVIIGGHDRMVCQYKKVCQKYQCKAKVFTQMSGNLSKKIGTPDLVVLLTNTVSHKMVRCAVDPLPYKQQKRTGRYPGNCLCSSVKTISFKRAR